MAGLDEAQRQRELDRYRVVDSLPDEAFDDIVRLAAAVCGTQTALVSMIDRERQWFKASTGFAESQTRRDEAFCDHAIRTPELLFEVTDAHLDPRFADNPHVTGGPRIRFYAGMPLVTPAGAAIGTVCVFDQEPRALNDVQRRALSSLARLTMNLIEGRDRERERERTAQLASGLDPAGPGHAAAADNSKAAFCSIVIVEIENACEIMKQKGERTFDRLLHGLHETLESRLRSSSGDNVSRVSGCAEFFVLLHGKESEQSLQAVRESVSQFEQETGLQTRWASAHSEFANERLEEVFLRADRALTELKDQRAGGGLTRESGHQDPVNIRT